jgi:hypothetical protein
MHDLECSRLYAVAIGDSCGDRTKREHASSRKPVMVTERTELLLFGLRGLAHWKLANPVITGFGRARRFQSGSQGALMPCLDEKGLVLQNAGPLYLQ